MNDQEQTTAKAEHPGASTDERSSRWPPVVECLLELTAPRFVEDSGTRRAAAMFRARCRSLEPQEPHGAFVEGRFVEFIAPLGSPETDALRWYVEEYFRWPHGPFRKRAEDVETALPQWGRRLFDAITRGQEKPLREFLHTVSHPSGSIERLVTIHVDDEGADADGKKAAAELLQLPWELLHDGRSYVFEGSIRACTRRMLPSESTTLPVPTTNQTRVRVLVVSARPEDERLRLLDSRTHMVPLLQTLQRLGDDVDVTVLVDATLENFRKAMIEAHEGGKPFGIVHFDGHGLYDRTKGAGYLVFERSGDLGVDKRGPHLVSAAEIGGVLRDMRVSLFVLDACQSGMAEHDTRTSVVAELMHQGVHAVVAMCYLVLVETARKFIPALYGALVRGKRMGAALVEARQSLKAAPTRLNHPRGQVDWMDWMVPILYQSGPDTPVFERQADAAPMDKTMSDAKAALRLGELPPQPWHGFVGRTREMVRIERQLGRRRRVSLVGKGGEGKTALAIEMAHWLTLTGRVERVAFVSVERMTEARAVLDAIGRQIIAGYSAAIADASGRDGAILRVEGELAARKTLLIIDNVESIDTLDDDTRGGIVALVDQLASLGPTWLLSTSRGPLPNSLQGQSIRLDELEPSDARRLVVAVCRDRGIDPLESGRTEEEVLAVLDDLIQAVRGHARSLVLLGPTLMERGIKATTQAIRREMRTLDRTYPGQRERSLLASARLSLRRLDEPTRRRMLPLAVVRRAIPMRVVADVLQVEFDDVAADVEWLVKLGLADKNSAYFLPDPALGLALSLELEQEPGMAAAAERRWRDGMDTYAAFLYRESSTNTLLAREGTHATMVDLLEALESKAHDGVTGRLDPDAVMVFATNVEQLVVFLGRPQALRRVITVRETLERKLPIVCRGRVLADAEEVERKLTQGDHQGAMRVAQRMVACADDEAQTHSEAEFDRARSRIKLGRVFMALSQPDEALRVFSDAERRFARIAATGHEEAERMEVVALTDRGNALLALEKFDEAAEVFHEGIRRDEKRHAVRDVAVGYGRLGTARLLQGQLKSALDACLHARQRFEQLGEPGGVAANVRLEGTIYEENGLFDLAERTYKESLRIRVELGDRMGEGLLLGQLASLYEKQDRQEDAVGLYEQAAVIFEACGNWVNVFRQRTHVGMLLHKLGRRDEARRALYEACAIHKRLDFAKDAWKPWYQLALIEKETKNSAAEHRAREEARRAYMAHRRAEGAPSDAMAGFIARIGTLVASRKLLAAVATLHEVRRQKLASSEVTTWLDLLESFVTARDTMKIPNDPNLDPILVGELQLALETLSAQKPISVDVEGAGALKGAKKVEKPESAGGPAIVAAMSPVVDVGIVVALQEEFRELVALCGPISPQRDELLTAYRFQWGSYEVVATFVGDMGETHATRVTERLMSLFRPASVVVVGIAAGVHDDLLLGDVYVPAQAVQYMQDGKAVAKRGKRGGFTIVPGAPAYRADHALLDAVRNLEFQHPAIHRQFREQCAKDLDVLVHDAGVRAQLFEQHFVRREVEVLAGGHVATGPVVGAASAFGGWIRSHDRNIKALEMESAAIWLAAQSRGMPVRALAIRGISDFGDDRKQALDTLGGGVLRKYSMRNAVRLLLALLEAGEWPHAQAR